EHMQGQREPETGCKRHIDEGSRARCKRITEHHIIGLKPSDQIVVTECYGFRFAGSTGSQHDPGGQTPCVDFKCRVPSERLTVPHCPTKVGAKHADRTDDGARIVANDRIDLKFFWEIYVAARQRYNPDARQSKVKRQMKDRVACKNGDDVAAPQSRRRG